MGCINNGVLAGPTSNGNASYDPSAEMNLASGATGWELALVTNPSSNESAVNNSKLVRRHGCLNVVFADALLFI